MSWDARRTRVDAVDVWAQQPLDQFMQQPWLETLFRWTGATPQAPTIQQTLTAVDDAGVAHALLSAWSGPLGALITNDEVADVVTQHPQRFSGVAAVDLRDPVRAVR